MNNDVKWDKKQKRITFFEKKRQLLLFLQSKIYLLIMKFLKKALGFLYQWLIFLPIFLVLTILTALTVVLLTPIFGSRWWGYYPPKWWSRITCWIALCRIKSSGHENLDPKQSYVFVANHQGSFDIFLTYGFLNQNIKWVQKQSLRNIPFVGTASEKAGHVFVDNTSAATRSNTIKAAKEQISDGVSIMMFPEGARTMNGKMGRFKKGAFHIAHDMELPIVPLTINGPYDILKKKSLIITPGKLELIIHKPINTKGIDEADLHQIIDETKEVIYSGLWEKYK